MLRKLCLASAALLLTAVAAVPASAHTIAFGTVNGGSPGTVDFWMGSYHAPGSPAEGSLTIGTTTVSFGGVIAQNAPPAGMVFGTDVFYASNTSTVGEYNSLVKPCCTIAIWQKATITGLTAGFHSYTISGMNTVVWADWNSSSANWTGRVFIPGSSVGAPEPASMLLFGFGLAAAGVRRFRRS